MAASAAAAAAAGLGDEAAVIDLCCVVYRKCSLLHLLLGSRVPRRRSFAGGERGSRSSQIAPNTSCGRVRATEHASRGPFNVLERRHSLAEIVERGVGVLAERRRVSLLHFEHECLTFSGSAFRYGNHLAQHGLGFGVAL